MNSDRTLNDPVYPVVVDKDVDVDMRDGARLKADCFRPYDDGNFGILNLGRTRKTSSGSCRTIWPKRRTNG